MAGNNFLLMSVFQEGIRQARQCDSVCRILDIKTKYFSYAPRNRQ